MKAVGYLLTAFAVALVVVWFLLLGPSFAGGPATYVMVSGVSMEPTLYTGDLVVVRKQDSYKAGDIVAYRVQKSIVIHRIVGGTAQGGFVMKGDNKNDSDPWHPTKDDIVGRMWFHVPGAGGYMARLRRPLPLATLMGGLAMVFVLIGEPARASSRSRGPQPVRLAASVPMPGPLEAAMQQQRLQDASADALPGPFDAAMPLKPSIRLRWMPPLLPAVPLPAVVSMRWTRRPYALPVAGRRRQGLCFPEPSESAAVPQWRQRHQAP